MDVARITSYQACLLHSRADRALRLVVTRQLKGSGLTMMEWLLLGIIGDARAKGVSMTFAAKGLSVSLPQVTALATKLIHKQFINQSVERTDRRSRVLSITEGGQHLLNEIESSIRGAMREWLAGVPRPQLAMYIRTVAYLANQKT